MKINEIITESESYQPPELAVGDKILKGKFKNSPAEIKGFKKDKHNQPVLKTNKGDVQLFKPRVTKLMTNEEDLTEIDYCHEVGDLAVDDANIIFWAESAGFNDDTEVFKFDAESQQMYFLKDNEKISAYVIVSDGYLRGIKNISKRPGQIMVLMLFIIRHLGQKLTISKDEKLSDDGFNWLCSMIKAGGDGLTITDQSGQLPDIDVLRKEWDDAKTGSAGPSEIFLEGEKQDIVRENKHPLMPKYKWLGREGIL